MDINVIVTQYDLNQNTKEVIARGKGHLSGNTLIYHELNDAKVLHEITFTKEVITLKRICDNESVTKLILNQPSTATVNSPYGMIQLETYTHDYYQNEDMWMVEYEIKTNKEIIAHTKIVWEMKGVNNELN